MALDTGKLEKVRKSGTKTIARCPACAEEGHDKKGEHLFIEPSGRFGCIVYPGQEGERHRKRIFQLAGIRERRSNAFVVRTPHSTAKTSRKDNILGRLGRLSFTHAGTVSPHPKKDNALLNEPTGPVPSVPKIAFTREEQHLLSGIAAADLEQIALIKNIFNGTIVSVRDKKPNDLGKNQRKK